MTTETATRTTEFDVYRHYNAGAPHYGYATGHGAEVEQLLNSGPLPKGTRIRRTVIYEVIERPAGLPDVNPFDHGLADGVRPNSVTAHCPVCIEDHPDRIVKLSCGHGLHMSRWEEAGRPSEMQCRDSECGAVGWGSEGGAMRAVVRAGVWTQQVSA